MMPRRETLERREYDASVPDFLVRNPTVRISNGFRALIKALLTSFFGVSFEVSPTLDLSIIR